jgi:hypothetical protein
MELGPVPIRVNPDGENAEVLWCRRIDPARAIVANVPLPESGRRLGDLLLHDGEPRGTRVFRGQDVPVFDELSLLRPSSNHTFVVEVEAAGPEDVEDLVRRCEEHDLDAEDWTGSVRMLCKECSEGRPHDHPAAGAKGWSSSRRFGFGARELATVDAVLVAWRNAASGRSSSEIEQAL